MLSSSCLLGKAILLCANARKVHPLVAQSFVTNFSITKILPYSYVRNIGNTQAYCIINYAYRKERRGRKVRLLSL